MTAAPSPDPKRLRVVRNLNARDVSDREIARKLGVQPSTVMRIRRKLGLPPSSAKTKGRPRTFDAERARRLHGRGLNDRTIADAIGVSRETNDERVRARALDVKESPLYGLTRSQAIRVVNFGRVVAEESAGPLKADEFWGEISTAVSMFQQRRGLYKGLSEAKTIYLANREIARLMPRAKRHVRAAFRGFLADIRAGRFEAPT